MDWEHTCKLYRQLPREVASISSAAASLTLIAAIICFISGELISIPCRPYMAEAKSRIDIVSVHSVSFSVNAPMRGSTWRVKGMEGTRAVSDGAYYYTCSIVVGKASLSRIQAN